MLTIIAGYVVMNDPPLNYDNNWNVNFETELDTGMPFINQDNSLLLLYWFILTKTTSADDFILVEPSGDIDAPPKTQQVVRIRTLR